LGFAGDLAAATPILVRYWSGRLRDRRSGKALD
jgi:hypothetical protein